MVMMMATPFEVRNCLLLAWVLVCVLLWIQALCAQVLVGKMEILATGETSVLVPVVIK